VVRLLFPRMLSRARAPRFDDDRCRSVFWCSHPLDTIKTRMQLRTASGSKYGLFMTGWRIIQNESFFALYKVGPGPGQGVA
jgi:hypothetical protein